MSNSTQNRLTPTPSTEMAPKYNWTMPITDATTSIAMAVSCHLTRCHGMASTACFVFGVTAKPNGRSK